MGQTLAKLAGWIKYGIGLAKTLIYGNLLVLVSIGVFVLGYRLPQVRLLTNDVFGGSSVPAYVLTAGLLIWVLLVLVHFLFAGSSADWQTRLHKKLPGVLSAACHWIDKWLISPPLNLLWFFARTGQSVGESKWAIHISFLIGVVALIVAAFFPIRFWEDSWLEKAWPLLGGFVRMGAIMLLAISIWLGFGKRFGPKLMLEEDDDSANEHQTPRRLWQRTGQVLSALLILVVALEVVWVLATNGWFGITANVYTVWAYFVVAAAACMFCALIDFLERNTTWPWRLILVIGLVVIASWPGDTTLVPPARNNQVSHVQSESSEPAKTKMAVDVETQESPQNRWVEVATRRLEKQPNGPVVIVAASGGGSRAAISTALTLEQIEKTFDDENEACVWLCSGVSGGGIALAAHYYPGPQNANSVDAVSADYLAPIYRGFLVPFNNRGESLTAYWDRRFRWNETLQSTTDASQPLLVYGVSDINMGRRVMVGFPSLPSYWCPRTVKKTHSAGVVKRKEYEPYSLSNLRVGGKALDVSLTRAARMSSSFPFGFEPTSVSVDDSTNGIATSKDIHFLDGGMIDNTGIDSVAAILEALATSKDASSKQLFQQLKTRGVLLIEIDAGKGAGEVQGAGPLHRMTQPIAGYNRGVYSAAVRSRDQNIKRIESLLDDKNFGHEDIAPTPATQDVSEIMTTLSLPRKDVRRLKNAFATHSGTIRTALQRARNAVKNKQERPSKK